MLIDIDLNEAIRLKITVNQFLLIKFVIDKIDFSHYQNVIHVNEKDIKDLIQKKILKENSKLTENLSEIEFTDEFNIEINGKQYFDLFYELYPSYVLRDGGTKDYLRLDINRCRKLYNNIIGKSKSKHDEIISALLLDLKIKRETNSMKYMKRMYKWLSSQEYMIIKEQEIESSRKNSAHKDKKYGDEVE